ncbi:MAG TPA: hypothetical protein VMU66_00700, partial [Gaiellales bacterium]|nr:hypothetical protein [Gaiellales bacterium]
HAGVVRKLLALDGLSLRAIWPFADGHPHAGYAFPLLHAAQAAAIGLTPADPSLGYQDLVPAFAALVAVVAYATGRAVSGVAGGLATSLLALWVSVTGSQSLSVAQQPRYVVTLLLVPAVLLLLVEIVRRPAAPLRGLLVGTVVVITVLHSTYVPVILLMVTAVAVACPPLRRDVLVAAGSAAAVVGWIYLEALWGLHYRPPVPLAPLDFVVAGGHRIALSGVQVFERRPEYAIGLVVLAIALRRRSGALGVLGLAAAVAYVAAALPGSVLLAEQLFGAGQVQRYAEEIPWVYVLGAAAGELAGARAGMVAAAAVLGSLAIDRSGLLGTAAASALSMAGAVVLLALGVDRLRRGASRTPATATAGSAMAAVVVAVALVAGSVDGWGRVTLSSAQDGKPQPTVDDRLTPAALAFFRAHQAGMPVVLAPFSASFADWYSGISYQLTGMATVYTVAISAYHSESELRDDPAARRRAVTAFLDPATAETRRRRILARYGVAYVALDLRTASRQLVAALDRDSRLAVVFRDGRALPGHSRLEVWRVSAGG